MTRIFATFIACLLPCAYATVEAENPKVVGPLVVKLIDEVEVPAIQAGALSILDVRLGDDVSSGQVLAKVDSRESESERQLASTELAMSRQRASQYREDEISAFTSQEARSALKQQKFTAQIAAEKAESEVRVSAAEKAEAVAQNEYTRAKAAREQFADSVSDSELESLRLKYQRAELERVQAIFDRGLDRLTSQSEVEAVKVAELAVLRAEMRQAVAKANAQLLRLEIEAKEQALMLKELGVAQHMITAPIDGTVVEVFKRKGEWVRPGDSVFRIISLKELYAEGFFSGEVRPKRGQRARLVSGRREAQGVVDFVGAERDSVSGEFRFLVRFDGGAFLPGDRVEIEW